MKTHKIMTRYRTSLKSALIFLLLTWNVAHINAQDAANKRGFQPGNSYALGDFETINTTNGNLMLHFGLGSLGPGRGGLSAGLNLVYNSKIYDTETNYYRNEAYQCTFATEGPVSCPYYTKNLLKPSDEGGWRYFTGFRLKTEDRRTQYSNVPSEEQPQCRYTNGNVNDEGYSLMSYVHKLFVIFPDGSRHEMVPNAYANDVLGDRYFKVRYDGVLEDCGGAQQHTGFAMSYHSVDGTFVRLEFSYDGDWDPNNNTWVLYFPDGSRFDSATWRLMDRNNNWVQFGTEISDQFGRSIVMGHDSVTDEDTITSKGFGGEDLVWRVKWKTIVVTKKYNPYTDDVGGCAISHTCPPSTDPESVGQFLHVIDRITLPAQAGNNLAYVFAYNAPDWTGQVPSQESNGFGELNEVALPSPSQTTPAHAAYTYYLDGDAVEAPWRFTREVLKDRITAKSLTYLQEYDGSVNSVTNTWTYYIDGGSSIVTAPDGGVSSDGFGFTEVSSWKSGLSLVSISPNGTKVEKLWAQNFPGTFTDSCCSPYATNPYVKTEFTSLKDQSGNYTLTAIKDFNYDKNGNVTRVAEYDFVPYSSIPRDAQGYVTGLPSGITPTRVTLSTYSAYAPGAGESASNGNIYLFSSSPQLKNAVVSTEISDGSGNVRARTEFAYDNALTTGNLTQKTSWDSTKGGYSDPLTSSNSISVSSQYTTWSSGATGKLIQTADARGTQTLLTYASVGGFDLYPTEVQIAYGTSLQRTEQRVYDFYTGLVTSVTDVDNSVTSSTLYDVFGRPTLVKAAEGKAEETRTSTEYSDVERRLIVRSDLNTLGDGKLVLIQHYDQLGRIRLARQLEDATTQSASDETQGIKVQTRYLFSGSNSYVLSSNPYRASYSTNAGSETTMGWTRSKSDNSGRLIEVRSFGGSGLPAPWAANSASTGTVTTTYDANFTTVTDQAGKMRRSQSNSLGQLVRVDEPGDPNTNNSLGTTGNPSQATIYSYESLGNLVTVNQGSQTRNFAYSSLGRLLTATNPESGTICYGTVVNGNCQANGYDANGNLVYKTDARGTLTTYSYDVLNRVTSRTYSDSTPSVTYAYDSTTIMNGLGRLASVSSSVSSYSYSGYDAMGRPLGATQTIGSRSYSISNVAYDRAGHLTSMTYPSGRVVDYNYDNAGRLADKDSTHPAFSGNLGDGTTRTYSTGIRYAAGGQMTQEQFGTTTAVFNKVFYNSRQQLAEILASTSGNDTTFDRGKIINDYSLQCSGVSCNATDNSGNLRKQTVYVPNNEQNTDPASWYQQYDYDSLNRLQRVHEYTGNTQLDWQQEFVYDRWGNRSINGNSNATWGNGVNGMQAAVVQNTNTNRMYAPGETEQNHSLIDYDLAGNQTKDTYSGTAVLRAYDAENRMTSETTDNSVVSGSYSYDGAGRRVKRVVGNVETWQVYGLGGELLAEYAPNAAVSSPQKEYGYRNGQLLVTATCASGESATYTNNPLEAGSTIIRAADITELRTAVNQARSHAGLSAATWTDASLSGVQIKAVHITELRTKLDEARAALGLSTVSWTDTSLSGVAVKAVHISELRTKAAETVGTIDIRWMISDQLGTPRIVLDQGGSLAGVSRHDYLPFGEELGAGTGGRTSAQGYVGDNLRQKFTDKERDAETGLDYFGARYYSSMQGRFTSVDPSRVSIHLGNPQSWNRYSYTYNNPLALVDENGKWPTRIHNQIIDLALPGLTKAQRQVIKDASWSVDDPRRGGMDLDKVYRHGLRESGESVSAAAQKANDWISVWQQCARESSGNSALEAFGKAFHTVSDMTSPAHEGYQVWRDVMDNQARNPAYGLGEWLVHAMTESEIGFTYYRRGLAIGATQKLFGETFGQQALNQAMGGINFGTENDPTVQEINRAFTFPSAGRVDRIMTNEAALGEALYEYRLGLSRGRNFNWRNQQ